MSTAAAPTAPPAGFPRAALAFVLILVLLDATAWWIVDFLVTPAASAWDRVFFRPGGDMSYYPFITAMADGHLGEPADFATRGQGMFNMPWLQLAPMALLVKLAGPWGFLLADVLFQVLRWGLLYFILRKLRLGVEPALWLAALISLAMSLVLQWPIGAAFESTLAFDRVSRPLLTDNLFLGLLAGVVTALLSPRGRVPWRPLLLAGGCAGLVPHGDFHGFFYSGPMFGVAWLWLAWRERAQWKTALPLLVVSALPLVALLGYLAWRSHQLPEEIMARLGLFPLSIWRFPAPWEFYWPAIHLFWLAGVVVVALLLWRAWRIPGARLPGVAALAGLALIYLAPWICIGVTEKMVQTYQFGQRVAFAGYYVTALALCGLGAALWPERLAVGRAVVLRALPAMICLATLIFTFRDALALAPGVFHPRRNLDPYQHLRGYRASFAELERFLTSRRARDYEVLASLDTLPHTWWTVALGKPVYNVDPFISNLPDAEVERRLLFLANVCQVPDYRYLFEISTLGTFHSTALYQFSPAHTYTPLPSYGPDAAQRLAQVKFYDAWNLSPPIEEVERIETRRAELAATPLTVEQIPFDLIILTNAHTLWQPDPQLFTVVYANRNFKVYGRNDKWDAPTE